MTISYLSCTARGPPDLFFKGLKLHKAVSHRKQWRPLTERLVLLWSREP